MTDTPQAAQIADSTITTPVKIRKIVAGLGRAFPTCSTVSSARSTKPFFFSFPPLYLLVLSKSFMHLPLRPIFCQSHPNFRGGRNANASEILAQLTKNLLAKSSTKRFREYIYFASYNASTAARSCSKACFKTLLGHAALRRI